MNAIVGHTRLVAVSAGALLLLAVVAGSSWELALALAFVLVCPAALVVIRSARVPPEPDRLPRR